VAETPVRAGPTLLTTANTSQTIYTNATTWTILRSFLIANETSSTVTVTVGVGTNNTDAAGKRLVLNASIDPGESLPSPPGMMVPLAATDVVYALSNTANGATVTLGVVTGP
jgi:hypothetical protein